MSSIAQVVEPLHVVDTHALIWYLTNAKKLGRAASQIFEAAEQGRTLLIVSAIVIAEMYYANQKFSLFANFTDMYLSLKMAPYIRLAAVEPDHILDFRLDGAIPEMHDRIIAGLARRLKAPLITTDSQLHRFATTPLIW